MTTRLLAFATISLAMLSTFTTHAQATDLGTGLVAIEDGDDRFRPAAVLHVGSERGFLGRFYAYGRDYGPVKERNYVLSLSKRFDISSKTWQGIVGLAGLQDSTEVKFADHPEDNTSFSSTNVGMAFGIHWMFLDKKALQLKATWDAHVFPAGTGFVFLANARKSALGLTAATMF